MSVLIGSLGNTQRAVLRELRRRGAASRAELAAACGVTPAAMSVITRNLVHAKIIIEGERRHGGRGAPQIDLALSGTVGVALGVHATRYAITMTLLDFRGAILAEQRVPGDFSNFVQVEETILNGISRLRDASKSTAPLLGAGIAMPTRFHGHTDDLDLAVEVTAWGDTAIVDTLENALGCAVHVENDANAAAIGEMNLGNFAGYRDFAYLYLSEGIGGALVLDGAVYRGMKNNAGEFGALVPRNHPRPSFEDLSDFCHEHSAVAPPDGRDPALWETYLKSEYGIVDRWLDRAATQVAQLIFTVAALIAPNAVYLGGTLPYSLRVALKNRIDLNDSTPFNGAKVIAPDIVLPDIDAVDAVAFGAAVIILLGIAGNFTANITPQ